jgi:hypothetical protein
MTDDALIDRFVEALNARGLRTLPAIEVPAELRTGPPDEFGWCNWKIRPAERNPWVAGLRCSGARSAKIRVISVHQQ